ncbi:hypothetical protein SAMN06295967_106136 [Belliella buryatensis]|uniref:Type IX secretion system membrane protein, PorP/SprF family n=1 Tax=Belliella buryatensis TaxID=1500549 RepID=A0A239D5W1_9BACT|nr:hypothetical protein [Belliella buryatensis]SNS27677.1 hypothetical protein SAMN06295967_106136 [Belliella buryatensis]
MKIKFTIIALLVFGFSSLSLAQEDFFGIDTKAKRNRMSQSNLGNVFRQAVSNFSFELAAGGNYLNNQMLFNSEQPSFYPIDQVRNISNVSEISSQDTLSFNGAGFGVPINLGVRLNLFDIFTLGGGYGREIGSFSSLASGDYDFTFDQSAYTFDKLYGTFGLVLYDAKRRVSFLKWRYRKFATQNTYMQSEKNQRMRQNYPWRFILEGEYGQLFSRSSPDANLDFNNEPYYGLALRVEREFSEYARVFVKAGVEFRDLVYGPENFEDIQNIKQSVYGAQIGLSISLPGTKRCKVQGCGVVMKHLHEGVEYRGSSIWNFQNRKVGQWY